MKNIIHMLITLAIIGTVSGGVLSELYNWAAPKIALNRELETKAAIKVVQPETASSKRMDFNEMEVYTLKDADSTHIGYAMVYAGNGFQGEVRLIVGLTPDLNEVTGLQVLEQVETPGLGTVITEERFTEQFKGLETQPSIGWVKGVPPENPNEIQAVTGATISSKAVVFIINEGLEKLRARIEAGGEA